MVWLHEKKIKRRSTAAHLNVCAKMKSGALVISFVKKKKVGAIPSLLQGLHDIQIFFVKHPNRLVISFFRESVFQAFRIKKKL